MHFSTLLVGTIAALVSATPTIPSRQSGSTTTSSTPAGSSSTAAAAKPSLLGNPNAKPNLPGNPTLVASLITADTSVTRFRRIQEAIGNNTASTKFDHNPAANPNLTPGQGGLVTVANRGVFPLGTGYGISGAVFFFAPCGMNTPHTHPRATETFIVSTNSEFKVGFVMENGAVSEFNNTLTQYQSTLFPVGSIHWQQNMECEPAVAIGALSADDPGTSSIAQNFFVNTNGEIVQAALGYPEQITPENFQALRSKIPVSFARGIKQCYEKCGIKY